MEYFIIEQSTTNLERRSKIRSIFVDYIGTKVYNGGMGNYLTNLKGCDENDETFFETT